MFCFLLINSVLLNLLCGWILLLRLLITNSCWKLFTACNRKILTENNALVSNCYLSINQANNRVLDLSNLQIPEKLLSSLHRLSVSQIINNWTKQLLQFSHYLRPSIKACLFIMVIVTHFWDPACWKQQVYTISQLPDSWDWIENCLERGYERAFRFSGWYFLETSRVRKCINKRRRKNGEDKPEGEGWFKKWKETYTLTITSNSSLTSLVSNATIT